MLPESSVQVQGLHLPKQHQVLLVLTLASTAPPPAAVGPGVPAV